MSKLTTPTLTPDELMHAISTLASYVMPKGSSKECKNSEELRLKAFLNNQALNNQALPDLKHGSIIREKLLEIRQEYVERKLKPVMWLLKENIFVFSALFIHEPYAKRLFSYDFTVIKVYATGGKAYESCEIMWKKFCELSVK